MKTIFLILSVVALGTAARASAGTIAGTVRAEGKPQAEQQASDGKYDDRRFKFVERVNYAELRDFVVYLDGPIGDKPAAPEKHVTVNTRRIAQKGAVFQPHVLPVVVGTVIEWPNNDEIFHNVFSMSEAMPFDLGLYKNPEVKRLPFDKAGRIDVFCSIHANMHCIVLVLQNPYFAMSDDRGRYAVTNIPPGTYTLKAWHERLPAQSREITVPAVGDVKADFVLGITNLPKY
jgi:plastocyanin